PTYVTNGNHDSLVQGNAAANQAYEDIATGCQKTLASAQQPTPIVDPDGPDPSVLLGPATASMLVPPDPLRRFVNRAQIRLLYEANGIDNGHGYDFVDINELKASCPLELQPCDDATAKREGAASYYAWDPPEAPGF